MKSKEEKIKKLGGLLAKYEAKLAEKMKLRGQIERTGSGDSFGDQVRDDTNVLMAHIDTIKEEIKFLTTK